MCISASPNRDALFLCPDFIGGIPIRKRNNRVVVHLNDAELSKLEQDTATAGMCREKYIRLALMGIIIHPRPPDNYGKILQQLSAYGNNLNQIAHVVNATGRATAEQLDTALQILEKTWDYVEDQQSEQLCVQRHQSHWRNPAGLRHRANRPCPQRPRCQPAGARLYDVFWRRCYLLCKGYFGHDSIKTPLECVVIL